jgi:hypothetical protein
MAGFGFARPVEIMKKKAKKRRKKPQEAVRRPQSV